MHGILSVKVNGVKYLRIATAMAVNFNNVWQRSKELEATTKTVKNPNEEFLAEATSKLSVGYNFFGGAELENMAKAS